MRGFLDGQELTIYTFKNEIASHQQWVRNIDSVVKELQNHYLQEIANFEDSLVELAIMASEHILDHEIAANSEIVIEQTRKAIQSLDNDTIFKIHLHPDDIEALEKSKSELIKDSSKALKVEITANESVDKGSCILETSAGKVDATLRTQLERLKKKLYEAVKSSEESTKVMTKEDQEKLVSSMNEESESDDNS